MGIDITQEDLIRLNDVRKLKCLPLGRNGKRLALSTLYRWALRGVRGVRLETLKVGGSLCTTIEALQRFFDAMTARANGSVQDTSSSPQQVIGARGIDALARQSAELTFGYARRRKRMDAKMAAAMKDPSLAHLSPDTRRRYLEAERELDEAGF